MWEWAELIFGVNYLFNITPYLPLWQMRSKVLFLSERKEIHLFKTLKFYPPLSFLPPSFSAQSVCSLQRVSMKLAAIAHLSSCFIQVRWNHAERCRWEELIRITLMFDERWKMRDYRENEWGSLINAEVACYLPMVVLTWIRFGERVSV